MGDLSIFVNDERHPFGKKTSKSKDTVGFSNFLLVVAQYERTADCISEKTSDAIQHCQDRLRLLQRPYLDKACNYP